MTNLLNLRDKIDIFGLVLYLILINTFMTNLLNLRDKIDIFGFILYLILINTFNVFTCKLSFE